MKGWAMALITYFTGVSALVLVAVMVQLMVRGIEAGTLVVNGLLGLRTPATERSQAAWEAGHRAEDQVGSALTGSLTGLAVQRFADQVGVPGVASGLLDQVPHDPAKGERAALPLAGLHRQLVE